MKEGQQKYRKQSQDKEDINKLFLLYERGNSIKLQGYVQWNLQLVKVLSSIL